MPELTRQIKKASTTYVEAFLFVGVAGFERKYLLFLMSKSAFKLYFKCLFKVSEQVF
jgi:hypothetical protein